ncbi:MAG: NAD(P)-dependent dehydrogenase (short-subunit alcohol dehydrogenase family) [Candidatus Poriferisodalaceae bacterium]|jgi:NAD(P)-dependent dehydrogenase (short-subunit alcohol dehydrogenase family)
MNIVITGANRGIGYEMARLHIERGDSVIAGCRNPEAATALATAGPSAILQVDVGDEASITKFGAGVTAELDGGHIDLLINNAGTSTSALGTERADASVLDVSMDVVLDLVRINGLSAAVVTRTLLPHLASGSKVANISSQLGSMVVGRFLADFPYNTSKAVMNMATVQLAAALEPQGITVACYHPGWVRTDMGGDAADLSPDESAAGLVDSIASLTQEQNGQFFRHDGTVHPW